MDEDLRDMDRWRGYWVLARLDGRRERLLALSGGKALPVFSSREEADRFLRARGFDSGWGTRETAPDALLSLLLGPVSSVERVMLDPFPVEGVQPLNRLVSVERLRFVEELLGSIDEEKTPAPSQPQGSRKTA